MATIDEIRERIDQLVDAGDEKALAAYVLEHFEDLPEDVQGTTLLTYFQEALEMRAADVKIADMQEKALEALEALAEKKE